MEKFKEIYSTLFKNEQEIFIDIFEMIVTKLESHKNKNYIKNVKYSNKDYIIGIIEVVTNNISWRRYIGKINGRILNNKHNYYCKIGVYEELHNINLKKYLESHKNNSKYLSLDSTFISNKQGIEKIGRNVYYKNKRGRKLSAIVDSKGIPINLHITNGNKHDSKNAPKIIDKLALDNYDKNKTYFLADKGYDSNKIRELVKKKWMKPIIARRKTKSNTKSLKKKEIKIYRRRIKVENYFSWMKQNAKVNNIYEKSIKSYVGIIYLCSSIIIYRKT